jgi:ribonucleoside-triphosphate reductase
MKKPETTDITLFVRTSGEEVAVWNRQRIVDALVRETNIDAETAETISREVEKQIVSSGISVLTTVLIRELVDAKLIEYGLEQAGRMHTRLGFPLYDVRELILHQNKENANVPHGPEGTNLILAEGIKKEYGLYEVFSQDVADAHAFGDFHLHGLGYIDQPYSLCQSIEYIKKYGMQLPHALTVAKPARNAEVLLAHMVRFCATLQGHCAGIVGWDALNLFFAPFIVGMTNRAIKQFAQMLIYEFSQLTSARGGQAMFTDIHLYWEVPKHFEDVPAIGPGGTYTGKSYKEYISESQRFVCAIFEVFKDGDATGKPFIFPRPLVHITEDFFRTSGHEEFLQLICEVAADKGNTCFIFDRGGAIRHMAGCSCMGLTDGQIQEEARTPWRMRCSAIQNVTINLPRLGYKANGDPKLLFSMISKIMALVAKAHIQKKNFIEKLLSYGKEGPLSLLTMNLDGLPYLRMDRATYLIGMVGLNELVQVHTGKQLHESKEALDLGLKVIGYMKKEADNITRKFKISFFLEQTPAESTAYRFARLDLKHFSPLSGRYVKGELAKGNVYYTNSTYLNVSAPVHPLERIKNEGRFHSFIRGGAITHLWLGNKTPRKEEMASLVVRIFKETENVQVDFSPEFTTCNVCGKTSRGLLEACQFCESSSVESIAKITLYLSRVSDWNKGKLAELKDRNRNKDYF